MILHVKVKLPYEEAKNRCEKSKDARMVEFRNEEEWNEVINRNVSI